MCRRLETSAKDQTFLPFFFSPPSVFFSVFNNFILTKDQKAKKAKKKKKKLKWGEKKNRLSLVLCVGALVTVLNQACLLSKSNLILINPSSTHTQRKMRRSIDGAHISSDEFGPGVGPF